jgi:hypothetical protein
VTFTAKNFEEITPKHVNYHIMVIAGLGWKTERCIKVNGKI